MIAPMRVTADLSRRPNGDDRLSRHHSHASELENDEYPAVKSYPSLMVEDGPGALELD